MLNRLSLGVFGTIAVAVGAWSLAILTQAAAASNAVLIRVGQDNIPEVLQIDRSFSLDEWTEQGLLVWGDRERESWQFVPSAQPGPDLHDSLSGQTRSDAFAARNVAVPDGASLATLQLPQLRGLARFRGGFFLTPAPQARILDPNITIRRRPVPGREKYPATQLVLRSRRAVVLRIPLRKDQRKIAWSDIPELPPSLKDGLPAGQYRLHTQDGTEDVAFFVEEPATRENILQHTTRTAELLESKTHPVQLLVVVTHLLGQVDEDGHLRPYLGDALDLLETAPQAALTPYLEQLRDEILAELSGRPYAGADKAVDLPTGITSIDEARMLIDAGRWKAATRALDSIQGHDSPRAQALAILYRGVIMAEAGAAVEKQTGLLFGEAIQRLADGSPEDRFRAHNNYANYLFGRAQDRLYNHAFQIASGLKTPLIHVLLDWRAALAQYHLALEQAGHFDPAQKASVEINMARLYALLADVIGTLDIPVAGKRRFALGEEAAREHARQLANKAIDAAADANDRMTCAIGYQALAHLAFRESQAEACRKHAAQAQQAYLQVGSLAGVEGIQRLLGLWHLQQAACSDDQTAAARQRKDALRHLLLSHSLSELLRQRISLDRIGLSRAGYFARRAYVNERIVELLIGEGKHAEALKYAELAKARALQDVLAVGCEQESLKAASVRTLPEILSEWPKGVAALEYFLGSERAWVFLVGETGEVKAYPLVGENGKPLASREIVRLVRETLTGIELQAQKMRNRLLSGRGFDHTWQGQLHDLYQRLIPAEVAQKLDAADSVLIVPHHILHYMPFAGLVTKPDSTSRESHEMVSPQFLLDRPFNICYAPSIRTWDSLRSRPVRPISRINAAGIARFQYAAALPGVERDMQNLKVVFGDKVGKIIPGAEVQRSTVKRVLGQQGLCFIATHGQNVAEQPLASYMLLNADNDGIDRLTAAEIFTCSVQSDVVVMSACYSGLADRSPLPGDDLFGLQRALLHSGARTVVSGLWDVYDETGPEIMEHFFHALSAGKPVAVALSESQRAFLKRLRASEDTEPWLHPYFWAVYSAAGDDRSYVK